MENSCEKAKVTFQRYVESDSYIFEDKELGSKFEGMSLGEKMLRQLEIELQECGIVGFNVIESRERNATLNQWFEFVVEFDLLVAMQKEEAVNYIQSFYDEYGIAGFFELGNCFFAN